MVLTGKKLSIDLIFLTNIVFCFFPISFILGNFFINLNLILFCGLGIIHLRSKILMNYLNDENFKQNLKGKQKKIDSMNYEMIREKKIEIIPVDDKKIDDDLKNNTKKFNLLKFLRLVETRRLLNGVFQINS